MKYRFTFIILLLFSCLYGQEGPKTKDTLLVGYAPAPPFIIQEEGLLEGINVWLWRNVADDLNIEYELRQMPFSEMLNALKSGDIDVSINPLTITSDRIKEMGFTRSFFASHSTVAVAEKSSWQKIVGLFNAILDMNFLRGFLLLFVILLFFGLLIWLFERKRNPNDFRPNHRGLWDGLWWSAVTLTTVGYGDKAPKTRWGKIAALGLMLSGLLFISGLTASIASSLTVNRLTDDISSFTEFKERKVGTVKGSSSYDFLKVHFFKDINQYESVVPGLVDLSEQRIDGFMYDEPILRYRIKSNPKLSKLEVLPMKFDVQFYAFGVRKGKLPLQQAISERILEVIETSEWEVVLAEYGLSEL